MDTVPHAGSQDFAAQTETTPDTQRRLAREADMLAEARAEIAAGLFVDAADVDAWIDSIGSAHERPLPGR